MTEKHGNPLRQDIQDKEDHALILRFAQNNRGFHTVAE